MTAALVAFMTCPTCGLSRRCQRYLSGYLCRPCRARALSDGTVPRAYDRALAKPQQDRPVPPPLPIDPSAGRYLTADELPAKHHGHPARWAIEHDGWGWTATCLGCSAILYETPPLPYAEGERRLRAPTIDRAAGVATRSRGVLP